MNKNRKGFTLIELLVVISIIGMLASVVLSSLSSARAKGRDASRVQYARSLTNALELYRTSNSGAYPMGPLQIAQLVTTLDKYITLDPVFNGAMYFSDGNGYEIKYTLETANYGRNNGCRIETFGNNSDGKTGCIGTYATGSNAVVVPTALANPFISSVSIISPGVFRMIYSVSPIDVDSSPTCSYRDENVFFSGQLDLDITEETFGFTPEDYSSGDTINFTIDCSSQDGTKNVSSPVYTFTF